MGSLHAFVRRSPKYEGISHYPVTTELLRDPSERFVTCLLDLGPRRPRSPQVPHGFAPSLPDMAEELMVRIAGTLVFSSLSLTTPPKAPMVIVTWAVAHLFGSSELSQTL
jgi:hypothetical protein